MNNLRRSLLAMASLALLFSCKSDDKDDPHNQPPAQTYPVTLSYAGMRVVEFDMWIAGQAENTEGLNIEDFMTTSEYRSLELWDAPFYSYTFEPDTVYVETPAGGATKYTYTISGDTIHMMDLFEGNFNFYGSLREMYYPRGMVRYNKDVAGQRESDAQFSYDYYTFENSSGFTGFSSPNDMNSTDTVIIVSAEVVYD